jgi:hypothetical protein
MLASKFASIDKARTPPCTVSVSDTFLNGFVRTVGMGKNAQALG